jgi:hypothetical protein
LNWEAAGLKDGAQGKLIGHFEDEASRAMNFQSTG